MAETFHLPFQARPAPSEETLDAPGLEAPVHVHPPAMARKNSTDLWQDKCRALFGLPVVQAVTRHLDLYHNCGYLTLVRPTAGRGTGNAPPLSAEDWVVFDVSFGVPLFDTKVNEAVCRNMWTQRLLEGKVSTHSAS